MCPPERETRGIPKGRFVGLVVRRDEVSSAAGHGPGDSGSGSAFGPFQLGDRSTRRTTAVCRTTIEFWIKRRACSAEAGQGSQPTPETKSTVPPMFTAIPSGSSLNVGSVVMSVNSTSKWTSELWQLAGRRGGRPLREREKVVRSHGGDHRERIRSVCVPRFKCFHLPDWDARFLGLGCAISRAGCAISRAGLWRGARDIPAQLERQSDWSVG